MNAYPCSLASFRNGRNMRDEDGGKRGNGLRNNCLDCKGVKKKGGPRDGELELAGPGQFEQ